MLLSKLSNYVHFIVIFTAVIRFLFFHFNFPLAPLPRIAYF